MKWRSLPSEAAVVSALVAPPFVVFVHPALELVRRNGEYFTAGYAAGWQLYLAAFALLTVGVALWFRRGSPALRPVLSMYLLSGVGWFAYTMAVGAVEPRWLLLALLGLILVVGGLRIRDRVEDAAQTLGLAGAVLVVGLASSVWLLAPSSLGAGAEAAAAPVGSDDADDADRGAGSHLPNVYHLVLDEFQTEMFEAARTEEVERALDGFLYFPEASTPYGRTEMGLASTFAPRSYAYDEPLADYIEGAYTDERSLLGILRGAGYETAAWVPSVRVFAAGSPFDETHLHRDVAGDFVAYREQARLVSSTWIYQNLPRTVSSRVIPSHHYEQLEGDVLLPDDAPPRSTMSFRRFLHAEGRAPDHGRYVLQHLLLPHFPHVLDADCGYVEGTRTSPVEQSGCAVRLIAEFLDRLRSLDRYDGSLILIQGDHGARYEIRGGDLARVDGNLHSEVGSWPRSRPLLLVKPPGSPHEGLRASPFPATLEDVGPTVADALGLAQVPPDGRVSLLADALPDRRSRYYHFYDKHPDHFIDGDLLRFVITEAGIEFDRLVPVPAPES